MQITFANDAMWFSTGKNSFAKFQSFANPNIGYAESRKFTVKASVMESAFTTLTKVDFSMNKHQTNNQDESGLIMQ